jgi:hypothetical protein
MRAGSYSFCGAISILIAGSGVLAGNIAVAPTPGGAQQASTAASIDVYDGFETPTLSDLWSTRRFSPGAVKMQGDVVRAGHGAVEITVHSRDTFEAGRNGNLDTERDELMEAPRLFAKQDMPYEFSFSMYFPRDFPIVPTRLVIAQWKQDCGSEDLPCSDDSPVLAFRYVSGELRITQNIETKSIFLYRQRGEYRGRWLDFRVQARFTPNANGRVKVWLDGKQLVDYTGVTADGENAATGYANPSLFYFKMGLYRDVMAEPMTVYIDEYRKRELGAGEL